MRSIDYRKSTLAPKQLLGVTYGFTVIEVIGILAVIAILAAMLLPALIRETDRTVANTEVDTLKAFADAFQKYVVASRTIPDQSTWVSAVVSQLGASPDNVLYNTRQQSFQKTRVFLIDPSMVLGSPLGASGLPYYQSNFVSSTIGSPRPPQNVRVMIVSSLGLPLPPSLTNGLFSIGQTNFFSDLWNCAPGTIPSDAAWSTWTGNAADVIVQRIDLAPLFFPVNLITDAPSTNGYYTIDGFTPFAASNKLGGTNYYIQGSVVSLYKALPNVLDTRLIVDSPAAYVFENGVWRSNGNGSAGGSGVMDLGAVVQQFLNATPNVNAANNNGNAQQVLIVNDVLNYMKNYNIWAAAGYPSSSAQKTLLISLQNTMMNDISGIYSGGGSCPNCPANPSSCP